MNRSSPEPTPARNGALPFPIRAVLVQQASGPSALLLELTRRHHARYAARHALEYWCVRGDVQTDRPPHWNKIQLIRCALQRGYALVVWLDADTLVVREEMDLRHGVPDGAPIGMCLHATACGGRLWHYNSGAIYVRNTSLARHFFDQVWRAGPVTHPWQEQVRINEVSLRYPHALQPLDQKWNCNTGLERHPNAVVLAWHGYGPAARPALASALARAHSRQRRQALRQLTRHFFRFQRDGAPARRLGFLASHQVATGLGPDAVYWRLRTPSQVTPPSPVLELASCERVVCRLTETAPGCWRGQDLGGTRQRVELTLETRKPVVRTRSPSVHRRVRVGLFTIATAPGGHFARFLASCERYGVEPMIFGRDSQYDRFRTKLRWMRQFVETTRLSHAIFCDAYDSVLTAGLDEILEAFFTFGSPIVFSAERNGVPDSRRRDQDPAANSPYRDLNAGFWVGECRAMRSLFERYRADFVAARGDQDFFTRVFLEGHAPICLDYEARLCQSLYLAEDDLRFDGATGRIVNHLTGCRPLCIHGNRRANMARVFDWLGL